MAKAKNEKKNGNGFSSKALIGTVLIVAGALGSFMLFDSLVPFRRGMPDMMQDVFMLLGSLSFLIIAFSVVLIYTYLKDYLELRSSFTLALLLAIVSFLMLGISSNPMVQSFFGAYGRPGFFMIMPYLFAALSLGILAWISNR